VWQKVIVQAKEGNLKLLDKFFEVVLFLVVFIIFPAVVIGVLGLVIILLFIFFGGL